MPGLPILRAAAHNTWSFFGPRVKRNLLIALFVVVIGSGLGFYSLGKCEAMNELHVIALYTFGPLGILVFLVFLWNLWLAPYELVRQELASMKVDFQTPKEPGKILESADLDHWKHVQRLKLYQVAELCGGVSPRELTTGSNDAARAAYAELYAALSSKTLKGSDPPHRVTSWTFIKREDLQNYFKGRDNFPEFLKD